jgi:hypothetical protein
MYSTKSQVITPDADTSSHWKMPTPPVSNNVPAVTPHVPVTPERRLAHELSSESIRVYSPPSGTGVVMPVPPHIAPLRGMAAQRYQAPNYMGSPFQSPPPSKDQSTDHSSSVPTKERGVSTFSGVSSLSGSNEPPVTLTPARYEAPASGWTPTERVRPERGGDISRPTTTFTEMLHEAGFPDPIQDPGTPAVPKIPNAYSRR